MQIGILKEIENFENRVAITQDGVKKLTQSSNKVYIQKGAGTNSMILDETYENAGAPISNQETDIYNSDIILKVNPPTKEALGKIQKLLLLQFMVGLAIKTVLNLLSLYLKCQIAPGIFLKVHM